MMIWDGMAIGILAWAGIYAYAWMFGELTTTARVLVWAVISVGLWEATDYKVVLPGRVLRDVVLAPVIGQRPAVDRLGNEFEERIIKHPQLGPELRKVPRSQWGPKAFYWSSHGMPRLGAEHQERRVTLMRHMLEKASLAECAAMGRGKIEKDTLWTILGRLPDDEIRQFFELAIAASLAEVRQQPYFVVSDQQIATSVQALQSRLSPTEMQRFTRTLPKLSVANDDDVCWLGKVLYREANNLGQPHRDNLRQALSRWD